MPINFYPNIWQINMRFNMDIYMCVFWNRLNIDYLWN